MCTACRNGFKQLFAFEFFGYVPVMLKQLYRQPPAAVFVRKLLLFFGKKPCNFFQLRFNLVAIADFVPATPFAFFDRLDNRIQKLPSPLGLITHRGHYLRF